jgi:YbgC/YbaW family acyl-CoA thioester hydrolase
MAAKPHIIDEYVRWSDVDFAGIICYGAYLRFFEIAETEMFRAAGLAFRNVFDRYNVWFPRAAIHSEFYRPARLDDRLRVAAYVSRVGKKSLTLNFDVIRADPVELGAAGYQVLVCVERPTLQSRVIPPEVVRALVPFTLSLDDARAELGVPKR